MSLYDVEGHPLLSEGAAELGPTQLEAHANLAEILLGFDTFTAFTDTDPKYDKAAIAVALQVSYQVESGIDAFILIQQTRGSRSTTFRGAGRRGQRMVKVHPMAKQVFNAIRPRPEPVEK